MADTSKKVSELETASQVNNTDLVMISQGSAGSGFASLKTTILAIAQKIVSGINFTSALETENKTIAGAINEVAQGGGGSSTFAGLSDVDIDDTTLANGQVPKWNSTTEKWENGNAGGGSGGHTILDDSGTSLAQEDDLQFKGTYSHDDSTNGKTVVEITREMTQAQYDLLSADEKKGIIRITDDNYVCEGSEVKYAEGVSVNEKIDGLVYTGDLNDLTETGVYGHSVTANSNAPSDVPLATILNIFVITTNLGITTQVAYFGNTRIYVRRKYNGSWNNWNNVVAGRFSTDVTKYGGYIDSSGNYTGFYPYNVVKCPVSRNMKFRVYNLSNNTDTYHRFLDTTGATVGNLIRATGSVMEFTVPTNAVAIEFTMFSTDYAPIVTPV